MIHAIFDGKHPDPCPRWGTGQFRGLDVGWNRFRDEAVGTIDLAISDLEYSSKMDLGPFRVNVPDGFKKTDEFAP